MGGMEERIKDKRMDEENHNRKETVSQRRTGALLTCSDSGN